MPTAPSRADGAALATFLRVLVAGTVVVVVVGLAGDILLYRLHLAPRARDLVRLNGEANLPAWWNSMLLVTVAVLAGAAADAARRTGRRQQVIAWLGVALAGGFLALDEATQIHEQLSAMARFLPTNSVTFQWVLPGAVLAVTGLVVAAVLVRRLPSSTRWGLALAAAVFLLGALVTEGVNGWINVHHGVGDLYRVGSAVEESLEMAGCLLAAAVVLREVRSWDTPLVPRPRPVLVAVLVAWAVVVLVEVVLPVVTGITPRSPYARFVYVWRESGPTAFVQAATWWLLGTVTWVVGWGRRQARVWRAVALVAFAASASELARLHELLGDAVAPRGLVSGMPRWVPLGVVVGLAATALVVVLRRRLPAELAPALVVAVPLLSVAAVAGDVLDQWVRRHGPLSARVGTNVVLESLELAAALIVLLAVLRTRTYDADRMVAAVREEPTTRHNEDPEDDRESAASVIPPTSADTPGTPARPPHRRSAP